MKLVGWWSVVFGVAGQVKGGSSNTHSMDICCSQDYVCMIVAGFT